MKIEYVLLKRIYLQDTTNYRYTSKPGLLRWSLQKLERHNA